MDPEPERERALRALRVAYNTTVDQANATRKLIDAGGVYPAAALDGLVGLRRSNYAVTSNPIYLIGSDTDDLPDDRRKIFWLIGIQYYKRECETIDTAEIRRLTDALLNACLRAELPPS